ncbi:DUF1003 domain-containing protein [Chelativorans sp. AA-79]|uniref:DUF1003 domain-containing protein n=1 Tax=Chelativorans sp. AA-79 TaxID=3028735 RepID=UPI0023F6583D|nr:DUF1003 domain-containing protein [Chelativorans sp. AA-79]WEX07348.1 DUF1003 domain-containing protein [Chelativorans sp. AA-79]
MTSQTLRPPSDHKLTSALRHNIEAIERRRARDAAEATLQERIADAITRFTGSMRFVYLHLAVYGSWILSNLGLIPGVPRFDPSFVMLAMAASVEAIFLSTFVLISQNRMAAAADKRADLDLQISLLTEHELTKLSEMVAAIADRLDSKALPDTEVSEIGADIAPEAVLDEIEANRRKAKEEKGNR